MSEDTATAPAPSDAPPPAASARPRPRSVGDSIRELRANSDILSNMVRRDFTIKYKNSFLGVAWSLLNPILLTALFAGVFTALGFSPAPGTPYPFILYFFCGLTLWNLFGASVTGSLTSIVGGAYLLKKVYFPREILPLSTILSNLINFAFEFVVVLVAIVVVWIATSMNPPTKLVQVPETVGTVVSPVPPGTVAEPHAPIQRMNPQTKKMEQIPTVVLGGKLLDATALTPIMTDRRVCVVPKSGSPNTIPPADVVAATDCAAAISPHWTLILAPLFVALGLFLAYGFGLFLSAATVFFRDLEHLVGVAIQMWFWLTPVIYSMVLINNRSPFLASYVWPLNPIQPIIVGFRQVVLDGQLPAFGWIVHAGPDQPMGTSWGWLLYSFVVAAGLVGFGYRYFNRHEPEFGELV